MGEINFRNAAKAFVVEDGKLLLLKRRPNDPHMPSAWDIPGGRLELGENPFEGLGRETHEEIGCELEIIMPLSVNHFVREDGQTVTLTIFLCRLKTIDIKLSEEHTEYKWIDLNKAQSELSAFFVPTFKNFGRINIDE